MSAGLGIRVLMFCIHNEKNKIKPADIFWIPCYILYKVSLHFRSADTEDLFGKVIMLKNPAKTLK